MYVVTIKEAHGDEPAIAMPAKVQDLELLTEAIQEAINLAGQIETEPQDTNENP